MNNQIFLSAAPSREFSVEAGVVDSKNFDHHGQVGEGQPSPCNNPSIPTVEGKEISITHLDADTLLGLARLEGLDLFSLSSDELSEMEAIDNGGSSAAIEDSNVLAFMVGIDELRNEVKFPFCPRDGSELEVTDLIEQLLDKSADQYVKAGEKAMALVEQSYTDCLTKKASGLITSVGLWSVGADDKFDPSRPYKDGVDIVVVYREHYKSLSIYCNGESAFGFGGKTVAGISFAGHEKACGSPRDEEMTTEDALRVFEEISQNIG